MDPALVWLSLVNCDTDSTTGVAGGSSSQTATATSATTALAGATIQRQRQFDVTVVNEPVGAVPESDKASRAKARSEAEWKRCSGLFSRHRCTIFWRAGGVPGTICEADGGSSFRMALIVSGEVGLWNARSPVNIS